MTKRNKNLKIRDKHIWACIEIFFIALLALIVILQIGPHCHSTDQNMASILSPAKAEYNYYANFVKHTKVKTTSSPAVQFLQLHVLILELMEALLTKSHDMDDIRFRCCDIMSTIFSIVQDLPQLRPCFPAVKHHTKWILEIDQGNRLGELMKASRGLLIAYINLSINAWDQSAFNNLKTKWMISPT
jgi:hypothetical protein